MLIPSEGATLSGTETLDGAASNPSAVTTFQYELTGDSYTNQVVATAKPTLYGWLAQEPNGTWGWDSTSVLIGTYTLTAVVTYNDGTQVTSPGVSVTVSNPAPTAQVLIPSAGATVSGTTFLDGTASYTANITQFSYFLDGAPIGNAVATIYGWVLFNWNTTIVANGSHTLTAVATYADGATATSPAITVTIANQNWVLQSVPSGTGPLTGISCPSATQCVAVGDNAILTTVDGGSSWSSQPPPTGIAPSAASCPTTTHCVAIGGSSTGGTPIALITDDGGKTWVTGSIPTSVVDLQFVSCPSSTFCVATGTSEFFGRSSVGSVGNGTPSFDAALVTTDGGVTWVTHNTTGGITVPGPVSCPSISTCVGAGTNLNGGEPVVDPPVT